MVADTLAEWTPWSCKIESTKVEGRRMERALIKKKFIEKLDEESSKPPAIEKSSYPIGPGLFGTPWKVTLCSLKGLPRVAHKVCSHAPWKGCIG